MTIQEQLREKFIGDFIYPAEYTPTQESIEIRLNSQADWWLSRFSEVLSQIEGKIEEAWNYPCNCIRNQEKCSHNYDGMNATLAIIKSFKNEERE